MTNLTVLSSYSLISDESITVSFGASIDRKKEQRWWHFAARHNRVCEEGGRWTCRELTRLKSLDSVLWSLRRLTGDFALSARGDDEAYKEILCKHRWRSETWARSRGCCLHHRLLNKPLMYFTFVSLPGSHTHCFHNRSRCKAVVGKCYRWLSYCSWCTKKQTNTRTSDISCSTHWGIGIIFFFTILQLYFIIRLHCDQNIKLQIFSAFTLHSYV